MDDAYLAELLRRDSPEDIRRLVAAGPFLDFEDVERIPGLSE